MKKTFCAAIALTFAAISAMAVTPVVTVDGLQLEKTVTHLTFEGDNVHVHYGESDHDVYDMESVRIDFKKDVAVSDIEASNGISFDGKALSITGFAIGTAVRLYDAAGHCLGSYCTDAPVATIAVDLLPAGLYIVSVDNESFKFTTK